ncbi:MAG: erythromycin esterase family protein [Candidatus Obscuribacterales bacterium]|nr:erythromycin esterase family protein [Candidatus Obscuribacterales bacterium]
MTSQTSIKYALSGGANALVKWARTHAVPIDLTTDNFSSEMKTLSCLDDILSDKLVVYLGEPDHFIRDKYNFQLLFIQYLATRGWNVIGKEIGRSDGQRINNYIRTGDEHQWNSIALYGYQQAQRSDRIDFPQGLLAPRHVMDIEPFRAHELAFLGQLRKLAVAAANGMRFFGYDIDVCPGGAYEDIATTIEQLHHHPYIDKFRYLIERVPNESCGDEATRLNQARQYLVDHSSEFHQALGSAAFAELDRDLMCLAASFRFTAQAFPEPTIEQLCGAFEVREQLMCSLLNNVLSEMADNDKLVLLGHNMHLSKKSHLLKSFNLCGADVPMWPSVGTAVAEKLPHKVLSIWMLYNEGTHSGPYVSSGERYVHSNEHSIEALLAQVGNSFVLPLATMPADIREYLTQFQTFACNGEPANGLVLEQADVIVFVNRVTGL